MKEIALTHGKVALVDDEDYDYLNQWKWWSSTKDGNAFYAIHTNYYNKKSIKIRMHRLIMKAEKGQIIDHIDGNGWNNQKSNLRFCTHAQNCRNKEAAKNSTSKYKGVYFNALNNNWVSQITINKKTLYLGSFKTQEEAAEKYNAQAIVHHKEFARLNII